MPPKRNPVGTPSNKKKRVPIHESRNKLTVDGTDPNYQYRWVNDVKAGTRLKMFENAGYVYESSDNVQIGDPIAGSESGDLGKKVSKVVGVDKDTGKPIRAYLMKIERDLYEEDQNAKAEEIREREKGMFRRRGLSEADADDSDGFYGGIKIQNR